MPRPTRSTPERRCGICGVRLQRKRFSFNRLEDYTAYMNRSFCSLSCANSREKGAKSRKTYHNRARKHRKSYCECCGFAPRDMGRLHTHHVNEDWRDNRPENLQTLCSNCHRFWHAIHDRRGLTPSGPMPCLVSR